jgi:hypothetical protein
MGTQERQGVQGEPGGGKSGEIDSDPDSDFSTVNPRHESAFAGKYDVRPDFVAAAPSGAGRRPS